MSLRLSGMTWKQGEPLLEWVTPGGADLRSGPLNLGDELAYAFGPERRCIGIWRKGRRLACSTAEVLTATGRSPQCPDCHAMERSNSVATDTKLDDPRAFSVYLAHHGSVIKVGITAAERGDDRLFEQGALASAIISRGSLIGARRIEILLKSLLGLPDRVSTSRKREARKQPGDAAERRTGLLSVISQVAEPAWPEGQERCSAEVSDHCVSYGLPDEGLYAEVVATPAPGAVIAGRIVCMIGPDLYLDTSAGLALLDSHLMAGWTLDEVPVGSQLTVPLEKLVVSPPPQDALF